MFMFVVVNVCHEEAACLYDSMQLKSRENLIYDFFFALSENGKGFYEANHNWR
jgi:hypothetical protein